MLDQKAWQVTAGSVVLGLLVAAGAVAVSGPWDNGQRKAERAWAAGQDRTGGAHHGAPAPGRAPARDPRPAPSAGPVLQALGGDDGDAAADDGTADGSGASGHAHTGTRAEAGEVPMNLARTLGPLLSSPALGHVTTASVVDVETGRQLYGKNPTRPMTPASTVKLATMTAALSAVGPDHRIPTTVVAADGAKKITLVGGGDPSLDKKALGKLADATARALRDKGVHEVALGYDVSLYSGPRQHPIGPNDNIAPVVALTLDEGRLDTTTSGPAPRSGDPAGDTAEEFVRQLHARGITATKAAAPAKAPKDARRLAVGYSAPVSDLIERALTESDNDIAEAMARQTALAKHLPASFAGGAKAVKEQLSKLRMPLGGTVFTDGSGLNRKDKVTAGLLTSLLARDGDPDHPELRPVLTGLPVAGFSGTLLDRYEGAGAAPADGLIRAKTGTLTGVNTLAGTVVDADGRLLAFAFMADATPSPAEAEKALDQASTALLP
ncbi:D-alanyl-D-alanine carboxypeptidase/D-alanyl-D-alanine endopeptidase [Streptomyces fuscigenes]|uniref:D-alanyl-D-alanine carboxypeptidase/D-alanyl-D-alanine endopeptidase n=1 Tax=Streptomyces fuscigenes TaxID=1528880 RepID=UPI001F420268|nr:D-alanyl-D-alanine carboxypeptidase/D-alanyl-D-alanine-endopeptidase [Streptomyces fuscigenes]MCF3963370.1 D-alanyl-D-alanine carboxypeptidase/D-alanyl-D-alanine-endopeptidase [Streptomyces fuscigenes]